MPKVALRLYRTRNVTSATSNPSESFSDALISLAETMNKEGLMFFEFGYECPYARNVTVLRAGLSQLLKPEQKQAKLLKETVLDLISHGKPVEYSVRMISGHHPNRR